MQDTIIDTLNWPPSALAAIESQRVLIVELKNTLEWLLENDELTQYGRKTVEQLLGRG